MENLAKHLKTLVSDSKNWCRPISQRYRIHYSIPCISCLQIRPISVFW